MNRIEKIEGVGSCISLERLLIYGNRLEKVEGLENNSKIKEIDVSRNLIKDSLHIIGLNSGVMAGLEVLKASYN